MNDQEMQLAAIKEVIEFSTTPTDFEAAETAVRRYYAECEKDPVDEEYEVFYARGMRDVRRILGTDNVDSVTIKAEIGGTISAVPITRMHLENGVKLSSREQYFYDLFSGLNIQEIFAFKGGVIILGGLLVNHIHVEDDCRLVIHNPDGPAKLFEDGSCMYALNDITVPEWVVMTPADEMDLKKILELENVDQRREALLKCGVERFVEGAEVVDTEGYRTLYNMSHLFDGDRAHYLSMINPTNGNVHIEGVDNECMTVQSARNFRVKNKVDRWNPIYIDGKAQPYGVSDQYQQGDITFLRRDAVPEGIKLRTEKYLLGGVTGGRHTFNLGQLYGSDSLQYLVTEGAYIDHPRHGTTGIPAGVWEVEAVVEINHITGIYAAVID